jgi:hypothetical protein
MPAKLRLDLYHSIEISMMKLSEKYGCGLMLKGLPKATSSDPLVNCMGNYGYTELFADQPARKIVENPGLLKQFYDGAFTSKTPLRNNFKQVYGHLEVLMAIDPPVKTAWFVADPHNRMALANYFRDAVSLGLKGSGVLLTGSMVRLTSVGWQNLYDLLPDKLLHDHRDVQRIEVLSVLSGVRWRPPSLSLGVTALNFREPAELKDALQEALGTAGSEVET